MNLVAMTLLLSFSASAAMYTVTPEQSVSFRENPSFKAIMEELKPYGAYTVKQIQTKTPSPEMSSGQKMIEEAKARNRAILAKMREDEKKMLEPKSEAETLSEMEQLKRETKRVQEGWKKEVQETRAQWKKEQDIFLGRVKIYKQNTFEIPAPKEVIIEEKVIPTLPDAYIVNGAFDIPVRDQKDRPTCSAFSGVRAVEIILAQNKIGKDLSEQYFYWASKPACQSSPCSEKGSWIVHGLDHSKDQKRVDIPVEATCSYQADTLPKNETHLPIASGCKEGVVKVVDYEAVRTMADVITKIKINTPVIVSAKLTPNYYLNRGLITLADENKGKDKMDGHSLGHAFLAVGVLELPEKMLSTEGRYCIVVTNSWGTGWGAGGFACITENWFTKNRSKNSFVAVTKISAE